MLLLDLFDFFELDYLKLTFYAGLGDLSDLSSLIALFRLKLDLVFLWNDGILSSRVSSFMVIYSLYYLKRLFCSFICSSISSRSFFEQNLDPDIVGKRLLSNDDPFIFDFLF